MTSSGTPSSDLPSTIPPTAAVGSQPSAQPKTFAPVKGTVYPETIKDNRDWLAASRSWYKYSNSKNFAGTDEELSSYGVDQMYHFNYNLALGTAVDAYLLHQAPTETKKAFDYMMDTYDHFGYTLGGAGHAATEMAKDPTTYLGLLSLGFGTAAKSGAQLATKEAIKSTLRAAIAREAMNGAVLSAGTDAIHQDVEKTVGMSDGYSLTKGLTSVVAGAAIGGALGAAGVGVKALVGKASAGLKAPKPWETFGTNVGKDAEGTAGEANTALGAGEAGKPGASTEKPTEGPPSSEASPPTVDPAGAAVPGTRHSQSLVIRQASCGRQR